VLVQMQLSLPRDASYVPVTRTVANSLLATMGVPEDASSDVQVALSEACANVVRHAGGLDYSVALSVGPEGCEIEVFDTGPGIKPNSDVTGPANDDAEAGRGLFLMRALVDDFEFTSEDDGTRVRLVKRWPHVDPKDGHPAAWAMPTSS
jgi:serine/threonine-protein kinase RsbW